MPPTLAQSASEYLQMWLSFAAQHKLQIAETIGLLIALLLIVRMWRKVSQSIRRRRPAVIHPSLQKYSVDQGALDRQRQLQAAAVVATSTGSRLTGFRIIRQVEAVFVEGFRTPEEAITALKAAAVERGANAVLNVTTARTMAGKCTASGDAVLVSAIPGRPTPQTLPPPQPPPEPPKAD